MPWTTLLSPAPRAVGAKWQIHWGPRVPCISSCHRLSLCSLYTCVLEAPRGREARKWLQLAVFCSPLAPGQSHLQLRIYFLNNTPCALQWAMANEQPHGGRLRGPCQLFDFTGARGDQCLKLTYISEGEGGGPGWGGRAARSPRRGRGLGHPLLRNLGTSGFFWRLLGRQQLQGDLWLLLLPAGAPGSAHSCPL